MINETFEVTSAAPWSTVYSVVTDQDGKYTFATLNARCGDVASVISLGDDRAGMLALAEALTRAAEHLPEGGSRVRWYIRDGVDVPRPRNRTGQSNG
jgi:hypothetical protein